MTFAIPPKTPSVASRQEPAARRHLSAAPRALQRKLVVGEADTPLEREAEAVARQVVAGPAPLTAGAAAPSSQGAVERGPGFAAPPVVGEVLASPGTPLAEPWLTEMQASFGHHFGDVRVHADRQADDAARQVVANAFTVGHHLVFAAGRFAPQTRDGRHLLAHELAHVVQQRGGGTITAPLLQRDASDDDPDIAAILRAAGRAASPAAPGGKIARVEFAYRLISKFLENYAPLISGISIDDAAQGVKATQGRGNHFSLAVGKDFVAGITAAGLPARAAQIRSALDALGAKPRQDYVFIMGEDAKGDPNQFYAAAETYYQTKLPQATLVKNRRNLAAVLDYVANTIKEPVGSLYLVSHANEDGTLSFPIDSADKDRKTSAAELDAMLHPAKGGSKLSKVGKNIDAHSKIRIKGCDIGRTQRMVELLDEAFGGEGTVTAPTHEQRFDYDADKATAASKTFRERIAKAHPEPTLDKDLAKKSPGKARQALAQAKAQRNKEIRAEIKARAGEEKRIMDEAAVFQEFSGPMFQRPGTKLYSKEELAAEVKALYPHLDAKQQAALVKELAAPDRRPPAVQQSQGTFRQQGQRLDRKRLDSVTYLDPQNIGEIKLVWAKDFAKTRFTAKALLSTSREKTDEGEMIAGEIEGTMPVAGEKQPQPATTKILWQPPPDEKAILASSRAKLGNPERYDWRIETVHGKNGWTTKTAIGERVITYLHHHSLRASAKQPFDRPESDRRFTAASTYYPAATAAPGAKP